MLTGKITPVTFPYPGTTPIGYTLPDGRQLLGTSPSGPGNSIARYTLAGTLVRTLVTGPKIGGASYSPDGAILAVAGPGGLLLVSNAGGPSTRIPVPGVSAQDNCGPVRWWNATTILGPVPARPPSPTTTRRTARDSDDVRGAPAFSRRCRRGG